MRAWSYLAVALLLTAPALADEPGSESGIRFVPTDYGFGPLASVSWGRPFRVIVRYEEPPEEPYESLALTGPGLRKHTLQLRPGDRARELQTDELRVAPLRGKDDPLVVRAPHGAVLTASAAGRTATVTVVAEFKIGRITIDDLPQQVRLMDLRSKAQDANRVLEDRGTAYEEAAEGQRKAMVGVSDLTGHLAAKKYELEDAKRADALTAHEQALLETRIANTNRMLDQQVALLEHAESDPDAPLDALAALRRSCANLREQIAGLEEQRESKEDRVKRLAQEYRALGRQLQHAKSDLVFQSGRVKFALQGLIEAEKAHAEALVAWKRHEAPGGPQITKIETDHYSAELWVAGPRLKDLSAAVDALGEHLRDFELRRGRWRKESADAIDHADAASHALGSAARESALGQWGIEAGDFLADVVKSWKEGGPYAAGFTVIRHGVENLVFPPTYYDPAYSADRPVEFVDLSWDSAKSKAGELAAKRVGSGALERWTAHYLKRKSARAFEEMWAELMRGSWFEARIREVDPEFFRRYSESVGTLLADQKLAMVASENRWNKLVRTRQLKDLAVSASKAFTLGMLKSVGKETAKKAIAEFFEGSAFSEYAAAQAKVRYTSRMWMRASNCYWAVYDLHRATRKVRDELIRQFDASTSMQITRNEAFVPERRYEIRISDGKRDPHRPSDRDIEVTLGGVWMKRSGKTLVFLLLGDQITALRADDRGELQLQIRILR